MKRGNNSSGPRWLFATRERPDHLRRPDDPAKTMCGRSAVTCFCAADPEKATCKNCLKAQGRLG